MTIFDQIDLYKQAIDTLRPFEGHLLKQLQSYYRIGLTWSSNAVEGNTLSISETKILLEEGLTVGGKPLRDTFEALGHAEAYDFMFSLLKEKQITAKDALIFHRLFYTLINPQEAGRYRDQQVFMTGSSYEACDAQRIEEEMAILSKWATIERENYHPVEFAAHLHKKFVFIHPFQDGNGRVARLLMNTALLQAGYQLAIIPPILRLEYINSLEQARQNDRPFVEFIAKRVLESEKEIMRLLHIPFP